MEFEPIHRYLEFTFPNRPDLDVLELDWVEDPDPERFLQLGSLQVLTEDKNVLNVMVIYLRSIFWEILDNHSEEGEAIWETIIRIRETIIDRLLREFLSREGMKIRKTAWRENTPQEG